MSELKGTKKVIIAVDYYDVDTIINKYYFDGRRDFEIIASEEVGNDSVLEFNIDGKLDDYDFDEIAERKQDYMGATYLNDLARQGIIDKGTYLISICW